MPKFYRQNKKKIDPRYFLNETIEEEELLEEQDDQENPGKYIYVVDRKNIVKHVGRKKQLRAFDQQHKSSNSKLKVGDKCNDCNKYIQPKNRKDQ